MLVLVSVGSITRREMEYEAIEVHGASRTVAPAAARELAQPDRRDALRSTCPDPGCNRPTKKLIHDPVRLKRCVA